MNNPRNNFPTHLRYTYFLVDTHASKGNPVVKVPVKLVTWDEIVEWTRQLAKIIKESGYKPDVVIAIARGGYVPARLICDFLGIENLLSIQSQHWTEAAKKAEKAIIKFQYKVNLEGMRALIVDDIVDTGESVILAKKYIEENWKPKELRIAAMQWISSVAKIKPDYYAIEVKEWIWFQYPWTRLEDITQFIRRIIKEELVGKTDKITIQELAQKFKEWYGIEPPPKYYEEALQNLQQENLIQIQDNTIIIKT